MRPPRITLAARYVFPVAGPPIPDGRVTFAGGELVRVGPGHSGDPVDIDLGNVAITPGFVNAHTHLDLDRIEPPSDGAPEDEVGWLRRVIASRAGGTPESTFALIARNVAASLAAGVTAIADISADGSSWGAVVASPLRGIVFRELIGLKSARGQQTLEAADAWLRRVGTADPAARVRPGLSPHAPYSTAGWLYREAAARGLPLASHLAEMPEELELLAHRSGPLRAFLGGLGAWDDNWEPLAARPVEYLRLPEASSSGWIIAHGNYFEPADYADLRSIAGRRRALAYCPRTHARFGHAPHPYRAMLATGVIVCVGTDSLASAPSLSILDEIRFVRASDRTDPATLLAMATRAGAAALGLGSLVGGLEPGKRADLAVIALPDRDVADPHDLLLGSDLPVVATVIEGRSVHGPWAIG